MDLFVYGTLTSTEMMTAVAGPGIQTCKPAKLNGYKVSQLAGNVVPGIHANPGASADGLLWSNLTKTQMARLDLFEGGFGYALSDMVVEIDEGPVNCKGYLPPTDTPDNQEPWSLDDWAAKHLAPTLLAIEELFSHDPLPDASSLQRMWPMIEARSWAKHRAKSVPPATIRRDAKQADFRVLSASAPRGSFFRFQSQKITHERFLGGHCGPIEREAFVGIDAALLLPYDPIRKKVALVEQVRLGPAVRRDPNPWMLEPIAGIIDARETPEVAAVREAQEEAGLRLERLEKVASYYPSPGASSDYFFTFIGICDLPMEQPYAGGLPEEGEDLRIHTISLSDALDLIDSGEIATGPLHHLLCWLALHQARFATVS